MKKPREWYCEVYERRFEFCIGWTAHQLQAYISKKYNDDFKVVGYEGLHCDYYDKRAKTRVSVIWTESKDVSIIGHECLHATLRTLEHRDVKLDYDNQEVIAYLFGAIMRKCIDKIKL